MSTGSFLRTRIFIIADDLTGACDAAVAFSSRGAIAEVLVDQAITAVKDVDVCAITTETRDISPEQARETIRCLAGRADLVEYDLVFKKIDSVFRGNTFCEIRAMVEAFPDRLILVAPAYPAVGRVAVGGFVRVRDVAGESSIAVREGLAEVGLQPTWIASGLSAAVVERQMSLAARTGGRVVFCDAVADHDLRSTVQAALATGIPVLWVGSAGLAHALAEEISVTPAPRLLVKARGLGTTLVFTGSDHPVTQRQVAHLEQQALGGSSVLLSVECGVTTVEEIRQMVDGRARTISCIVMTGGNTAMLVCRALGIQSLRLDDEFEAGIPQATVIGGPFAGARAILKSGGFGTVDVLSRIVRYFNSEKVAAL